MKEIALTRDPRGYWIPATEEDAERLRNYVAQTRLTDDLMVCVAEEAALDGYVLVTEDTEQ